MFFLRFRRSRVFASLTKLYVTKPEYIHILVGLAEGEARVGSSRPTIIVFIDGAKRREGRRRLARVIGLRIFIDGYKN